MNRHFILFALAFAAALSGVAKTFDVDISTGRPAASNEAYYHGETIEFRAVRGRSVVTNVEYSCVYYQTNGMDSVWWHTDGLVFHPTNDVGAASYRFFLEGRDDLGRDWHANGLLRLLPSPGFTPNEIELPVARLDFAAVDVLNPPWTDPDYSTNNTALVETIESTAPAPGDYAAVSNAAVHAAITNALQDTAIESNRVNIASNRVAISTLFDSKLDKSGGTLNGGITVWGDSTFYGNVFSFSDSFKIKFMDAVMTPYFEIFGYDISLPLQSGTLALVSDIPTTMAWSAITGKPTIPSTAADIGALPIDGGTMTGNLVMGYNSLFQINGGGNAKFQFSWGSALDNLIISAYRETSGSYSIRFPTREGLLALTSDIPSSMAWDAITGKPTTISGYGITDALKSDFTSLTNNAAFTSAVAAVSPPTDLTHVEAEIETNRTAIATLSARAYIEVVSADEVYYVFTTNQE